MLTLSIIGCGKVAKSMAYLWHHANAVEIVDVINRSQATADESVRFIGAGNAKTSIDHLKSADIYVIGCQDDIIETCCDQLAKHHTVIKDSIVFHFSGAKSSNSLHKAKAVGAKCASLHPIKSFAKPSSVIKTFDNTYCGLEGDEDAVKVLQTLTNAINGISFNVEADKKLTYHAASVFACNYMVALQELSLKAFEHSGVDRALAMNILEPIVKETADNIFKLGTEEALTGPIARGDHKLVTEQYNAVSGWDAKAAEVYRLLGQLSADLSDNKINCDSANLSIIKKLFK